MRITTLAFLALLLAHTIPASSNPPADKQPARFLYPDDHDQRPLAAIDVHVRERGGRATLELSIRAMGPGIAPIPGYRGVAGANRFTAEQFERLLSGAAGARVETRRPSAAAPWLGSMRAGKIASLPERRLLPDRRIDYLARTDRAYPVEVIIDGGPLERGKHVVEIVVDGAPRLRVACDYGDAGLHVTSAEFLAAPLDLPPPMPVQAPDPPEVDPAKPEPTLPPPIRDEEWDGRDLEGRWALYRQTIALRPATRKAWTQYLIKRREFAFLEQVALFDDVYVVRQLAKANAPQWIRLAVWFGPGARYANHGESVFQSLLTTHDPAAALTWLDKHQTKLPKDGPVARIHAALKKAGHKPVPIEQYLPPLEAADVFRHLDAPPGLEDFGNRVKAEQGVTYLQQVERALQGLVNSGTYEEPWLGKARQLTRHGDAKLRQAAFLAYSHMLSYDPRQQETMAEFLKVVDDAKETNLVREAAFLALGDVYHPKLLLVAQRLALARAHPAWRAAVSRLGSGAFGYAQDLLAQLPTKGLNAEQSAVLDDAKIRIRNLMESIAQPEDYLATWLELVAWAELTDDPNKKPMAIWTKDHFTRAGGFRVDAELRHLLKDYQPQHPLPGREKEFRERVLSLVREIQASRVQEGRK